MFPVVVRVIREQHVCANAPVDMWYACDHRIAWSVKIDRLVPQTLLPVKRLKRFQSRLRDAKGVHRIDTLALLREQGRHEDGTPSPQTVTTQYKGVVFLDEGTCLRFKTLRTRRKPGMYPTAVRVRRPSSGTHIQVVEDEILPGSRP